VPHTDHSMTTTPLGHHEQHHWPADPTAPPGGRRGGAYELFVPDHIAEREFVLDREAVAAVAATTEALAHLSDTGSNLTNPGAVADNLLRCESAASSRIEGIVLSYKRLARAAYARASGRPNENRANEVLGNVQAMEQGLELGAAAEPFTVANIQNIHRTLLRFTYDSEISGVIRTQQNWIGGNNYHPLAARYVGPPPEHVPALLEDLCVFIARTDLAPMTQAAIAHAQFETIHPFADGNGRTGRVLIHMILRRRDAIERCVPPISLVLAGEPDNYFDGLGAYRSGNVSSWCAQFAQATVRAASEAERLATSIEELQASWLERLAEPSKDAALRQLVSVLPAHPVIDVPTAQEFTGESDLTVQDAIAQLQDAGILKKWGRAWECRECFALLQASTRA
jgi:Fic family protein